MKKLFFVVLILSVALLSLCVYANTVSSDLENEIIRLHILARSNSDEDQRIKLAVRDEIINAVSDIPITDTEKFLSVTETCANRYLEKNHIPYHASAEFGTFMFPQKSYGNITLPAGRYRGVRVLLDKGKGRNWWCVMYPPLCVSEKSEQASEVLKQSLSKETYNLVTQKPDVKFKIIEFFTKLKD